VVVVLQGEETASGDLIFDGTFEKRHHVTRKLPPIFYLVTPSGRICSSDWDLIMAKFISIVMPWLQGIESLLYLDNLSVHQSSPSLNLSIMNDMIMLFLPPNTTHLHQPLDNLTFKTFKTSLKREMSRFVGIDGFSHQSFTQVMLKLSHLVVERAFSPKVIQKSFYNTGLFPWNGKKILERAEHFFGVLSPSSYVFS
jgi:hypothetical protein